MGGMHEIVDLDALNRWFAVLALVLPLVGLMVGAGWGARRGQVRQGTIAGVIIGALGTLNWVLWVAYNAITERLGLDTVRNVVVNLTFFVVVGMALGAGVGLIQRRLHPVQSEAELISEEKTGKEAESAGEIL